METIPCNLCHHESARLVYEVEDTNYGQPGVFSIVECSHCGLVYLNPRPKASEIGAFYLADQYHPFRAIQQTHNIRPNKMQRQRAAKIAAMFGHGTGGTVLDVGCGNGLFLLAMQAHGWQVQGVEPNETAVAFANERLNLPVTVGDIFQISLLESFDLITFWDVLEHTHSPKDVLLQANLLLKPDGVLAINVPNWASWERELFKEQWIALDAPRHLYHFSPETLTTMLNGCGFDLAELRCAAPVMNPASNLLRFLGNARRRARPTGNGPLPGRAAPGGSESPSAVKRWLIRATYLALTWPNFMANVMRRGGSFTVFARKRKAEV